jgi:hypothetical protein
MNANGRRARQAAQNFNHLTPRQRPNFKRRDAATAARHREDVLRREREREQRKSKSKK